MNSVNEDAERHESSEWLLEPPGQGEVHLRIAVGDDVELSDEVRQEIESLIGKLQVDDVQGFIFGLPMPPAPAPAPDKGCPSLNDCGWYSCQLKRCTPLTRAPCAWNVECKIQP